MAENSTVPVWKRSGFWPRFVVASAALIFIGANSLTNFAVVNDDPECIVDKLFDMTVGLNTYFKDNVIQRNILMIVVALILDFSIFMTSYCWIMYGKTWRPLVSLGLFYILRCICQNLFLMKFPDTMIWEYPGFPSFAVSYHTTSDFFFAGQIGIFLVSAIELWAFEHKICSLLAYFGVILHFCMMIALRGHYFIDLVSGLMAAHYFHLMADYLHPYMNKIYNLDENEGVINQENNEKFIVEEGK
jgi:hypothetical protein